MVLAAIIFAIVGVFISVPIRGYADTVKRAGLVDVAALALGRMEREIRGSLPNSLRVKTSGNFVAIEFVNIVEALRYRAQGPGTNAEILNINASDTEFNVLGQFQIVNLSASNNYRLVIYNVGAYGATTDNPVAGANIYAASNALGPNPPLGSHVATPVGNVITFSNPSSEGHIVLATAHQFAFNSPLQRLYIVDTPISYICNLNSSNNDLNRYTNYSFNEVQPINPSNLPLSNASAAILANKVSSCNFTYQAGTSQRNAILTLDFTIQDGVERVRLLQQISVANAP